MSSGYPLVSVVVPMYNQSLYVEDALQSILQQTYEDIEVVVVDDGSHDNGYQIASGYAEKDSRVIVLRQDNLGPSCARNNAIVHSLGKYILPVDADDLLHPTCIEKMVTYLEQHPECSLVTCDVQYFGARTDRMILPDYSFDTLLCMNCMVCTSMFRREDFDKTSGYNQNMRNGLEDWDFWLTLLNKDSIVHKIDEVLFFYRIKEQSRNVQAVDSISALHRQIYLNHPDLYKPYIEGIVDILQEKANLRGELDSIKRSRAYRLAQKLSNRYLSFMGLLKVSRKH